MLAKPLDFRPKLRVVSIESSVVNTDKGQEDILSLFSQKKFVQPQQLKGWGGWRV